MSKLPLLLLGILLGACGVVRGQSFDLTTGRVPVASIDGLWRFHTGDNPAWADPKFDDSGWSLLRSDKSWSSQGYKDYSGLAWYRFQVIVPAGLDHVSLSLPRLTTCYEVYSDGRLIGTFGKMPPNTMPYGGGGFQVYPLPPGRHWEEKIEVALRVWHWPGWAMYVGGGPQRGGGLVGDTQEIENQNDLERAGSFRSLTSTHALGLLETLAGLGALALFVLRRKEPEYLWFSLMMLLSTSAAWYLVFLTTQVWNVELGGLIVDPAYTAVGFATIAFYQRLLRPRRTWLLAAATASVALNLLLNGLISDLSGDALGIGFENIVSAGADLILNVWIVTVVFNGLRQKLRRRAPASGARSLRHVCKFPARHNMGHLHFGLATQI